MEYKDIYKKDRAPARSFEDLVVWQKAHEATLMVYKMTKGFPSEEKFGLTSQFRRAAVSIAANISEGFAKKSQLEKIRFLNIAQGSLAECNYYLILSKELEYELNPHLGEMLDEVGKMLNGYINKLKDDSNS